MSLILALVPFNWVQSKVVTSDYKQARFSCCFVVFLENIRSPRVSFHLRLYYPLYHSSSVLVISSKTSLYFLRATRAQHVAKKLLASLKSQFLFKTLVPPLGILLLLFQSSKIILEVKCSSLGYSSVTKQNLALVSLAYLKPAQFVPQDEVN